MATEVEEMVERAKTLISERRHQEAVRACRRALLSRPDMHEVRLLLGTALLALSRHDEARAEMMGLLRRQPDTAAAHRLLGEAYLRSSQPERARESLARALELDASDQAARELLGEAEEEDGRQSPTIDRWFDPEAVGTIESDLEGERTVVQEVAEDLEGEATVARPSDMPRLLDSEIPPSMQDSEPPDDLEGEATVARPVGTNQLDLDDIEEVSALSSSELARDDSFSAPPARKPIPELDDSLPYAPTLARPSGSFSSEELLPPQEDLDSEPTRARPSGPPSDAPPAGGGSSPGALPSFDSVNIPSSTGPGLAPSPHSVLSRPGPSPSAGSAPLPDDDDDLDAEPTRAREVPEARPRFRAPPPDLRPATHDAPAPRPMGASVAAGPRPAAAAPAPAPPRAAAVASLATDRLRALSGEVRRVLSHLPPRARSLVLAVPLLVVVGVILGVVFWFSGDEREELDLAVRQAGNDGLSTTFARAIALDSEIAGEEPQDIALRARLYATALVEHGGDTEAQANGLLGRLPPEGRDLPEARVASAYLALARGDLDQVGPAVAPVGGEDDAAVEAVRVQALAALEAGDLDVAFEHARTAVTLRPTAPRHVALYALLLGLRGDVGHALGLLEGLERANEFPAVRVARARILMPTKLARAAEEAEAVLETLGSVATPPQRAWAHLVRAQKAFADADRAAASREAQRAAELAPRGAVRFTLVLIQLFLDLGAADLADELLQRLPKSQQESSSGAQLRAEVALARGDMEGARRALRDSVTSDTPRVRFIRGRIEEADGNLAAAKGHYAVAAEDKRLLVATRVRLAAIAMREGDPKEAVSVLEAARSEEGLLPAELTPLLVEALIASKDLDRASREIGKALANSGELPTLVLAKARIELAMGKIALAVRTLQGLKESRPTDAAVLAAYGMAVRRKGDLDRAREALERALEIDGRNRDALLGVAQVVLDGGDLGGARDAIERARAGGVPKERLHGVVGRLKMLEGMGEAAVTELRAVPEAERDAATWSALGWAYLQAEARRFVREADRAFQAALREDPGYVDAHLGLGYYQIKKGNFDPGAKHLDRAERHARERKAGDTIRARITATRARIPFQNGREDQARKLIDEALDLDSKASEAHFVSALVSGERSREGMRALRMAAEGRRPMPESWGLLVAVGGVKGDPCELARRYMRAAPNGIDAGDVKRVLRRCR